MDFKIYEDSIERDITISGKITQYDIGRVYVEASTTERKTLDMMKSLAENSRKISDWLMYFSELMKVEEDLAKEKHVGN